MSVHRGGAEIICSLRVFRILTQLRHWLRSDSALSKANSDLNRTLASDLWACYRPRRSRFYLGNVGVEMKDSTDASEPPRFPIRYCGGLPQRRIQLLPTAPVV